MTFKEQLNKRKEIGNEIIKLWGRETLCQIHSLEWWSIKNKTAQLDSAMQDVCLALANGDKDVAQHYHKAEIDYLIQKFTQILEEMM